MDDYLRNLSPWDPNGSLSNADADRIWASYKAAGGGKDVSASLPIGGGLPSGDGGRFTGARSMFGSMAGGGGGLLAMLQSKFGGGGAPAVPADGAMQATVGPGAAPPAAPAYTPKVGLPKGGLLAMMQGGQSQGLMGLLQHLTQGGGSPLAGRMPQAGMLPGMPGSPMAGPVAPTPPQLPMNINPADQF
jgi:hypothetical protein